MRPFHLMLFRWSEYSAQTSLLTTFDEAYAQLQKLPTTFVEPDGSFAWSGGAEQRIEGQLFDQGERLNCVELRGRAGRAALERIISFFGSAAELMVQCNQTGQIIKVTDFLSGF